MAKTQTVFSVTVTIVFDLVTVILRTIYSSYSIMSHSLAGHKLTAGTSEMPSAGTAEVEQGTAVYMAVCVRRLW